MGRRIGSGLGRYFLWNAIKGTTVRVAVILRECNNGDDNDDEGFDIGTIAANDGANATTPSDPADDDDM